MVDSPRSSKKIWSAEVRGKSENIRNICIHQNPEARSVFRCGSISRTAPGDSVTNKTLFKILKYYEEHPEHSEHQEHSEH